jgi:hypothetical protein
MKSTPCHPSDDEKPEQEELRAAIRDQDIFDPHALLMGILWGVLAAWWTTGIFADLPIGLTAGGVTTTVSYLVWRKNGLHHRLARRRRDRT